ncbi:hypothetical protein [Silvanigrella sp.]|jgi:hypothetical protein|uniref:hypothetical protein n=1 Tax=Silvanigrella sp. TaxID=2024976 RepID=UPI0037CB0446
MSEVDPILRGLNTPAAYLIYSLIVLYGVYRFIMNISEKFIEKVTAQLASINTAINNTNSELSKTRESLVGLQHQHLNLEDRVEKIEDKIK